MVCGFVNDSDEVKGGGYTVICRLYSTLLENRVKYVLLKSCL